MGELVSWGGIVGSTILATIVAVGVWGIQKTRHEMLADGIVLWPFPDVWVAVVLAVLPCAALSPVFSPLVGSWVLFLYLVICAVWIYVWRRQNRREEALRLLKGSGSR